MVLIIDETADEKSPADCADSARQYSGTVGGIAMWQVAVTLTCAASAGHAQCSHIAPILSGMGLT